MSTFARFATRMQLGSAFRTFLLPNLSYRLLDFCFCNSRGTNPNHPRFIGLLHGALGMDAADRIRGLAADGTDILRRRWDNNYGLFATHVAPKANAMFDRSDRILWRCGNFPHFALSQQNNRPSEWSCRRSILHNDYPTQRRPPPSRTKSDSHQDIRGEAKGTNMVVRQAGRRKRKCRPI